MTIYPVVHYKTGGMDPFRCVGALCFTRAPVQRRINSRWPYMIFHYATMVDGVFDS